MTSFRMIGNGCIWFYEHAHFEGERYLVCEDGGNIAENLPGRWNDKVTSLKYECKIRRNTVRHDTGNEHWLLK